ncbi:hypothetical protein AVEN_200473-1 [Araneus ventricosus]|uniref:C2H2-type domain-containing protein n=1 Tax=Araneus ventricosus TaxID=182803 RepID=A0A4Y2IC27_ARAVE|nr:hypothetical protein AVEN_200473-1 [Araneus ventricosus]
MQVVVPGNQTCVLCDEKFYTMALLHEHIQNQHSITLKFVDETFYSEKDFLDWKNKIQKESLSSYVYRNSSQKKVSGITKAYYTCHRSGRYEMKQNRIRSVKASGSIKTGSTCPAFMKVSTQTIDGISEIKVQYQSVHLGHDLETRGLRLKKEDRVNLAACLKLGIPMDKILDEARRNFSPTNRYSHLTRKHLHNIRRDFGIPMNNEKLQKISAPQSADVEASDSSIGYEDYVEIEVSNHEEIQEHERNAAVSSLLLLQNNDYYEEFSNRKMQIINQLKELQSRIEEWDPQCPLPDVEEHIKALNARLDISAPSNRASHVQGILPIFPLAPLNKPITKRRKITKTKKGPKKNQLN